MKKIWQLQLKMVHKLRVPELGSSCDLKITDLFHPHRVLLIWQVDGTVQTVVRTVDTKKASRHHRLSHEREREREEGSEAKSVEGRRKWRKKKSGIVPRKNLRRCRIFCCWQDAVTGNLRRSSNHPVVQERNPDAAVLQFGWRQRDRSFGYVRRRHHRSRTLLQTRRRERRSRWRYQFDSRPGKY